VRRPRTLKVENPCIELRQSPGRQSFSISLFKPAHDPFHGVREQVRVGIEGHSCGRVPEVVLNRLDVCTARNEKRCAGMA
jgi:hypothetical protein